MSLSDEHRFVARYSVYPGQLPHAPHGYRWRDVAAAARLERTSALVYSNMVRERQDSSLPPWLLDDFRSLHASITARNIMRFDQCRILLESMNRTEIACIPLKGIFLARYLYPDPGMRDMSDIDLLIRLEDLPASRSVMSGLGYRSPAKTEGAGADSTGEFLNSEMYRSDDPAITAMIHLHWHLVNASVPLFMYTQAIDLDSVFASARAVDWDGLPVPAMTPHHLMVYLAEHAMKHSFEQLIFLSDIAQLILLYGEKGWDSPYRRVFPELDWDRVLETAGRWRLLRILKYAFVCLSDVMGVSAPARINDTLRKVNIGLEGRYVEASLRRNRRWMGLSIFAYLSLLDRVRDKAIFLKRFLVPPGPDMRRFGKPPGVASYLRRGGLAVKAVARRASSLR